MQKATIGLLAIICALLLPLTAGAQGKKNTRGIYGSLSAGIVYPLDIDAEEALLLTNTSIGTSLGAGITAAIGYDFGDGPRVEFEFGYSAVGIDSVSGTFLSFPITGVLSENGIDAFSFLVNGYYTWPMSPSYALWAGGGAGFTNLSGDIVVDSGGLPIPIPIGSGTDFTINGQFGADFDLGNNLWLSPYYRLTWINSGDEIFDNFISHSIFVGVRYLFNPM